MNCKDLEIILSLWLRDRRFVQSHNKSEQGFTLIELLVVIIIIGILAAIALPAFLNQANKARFAEAKSYIGTMSRLQQAYYLEKKTFTSDITKLGLGANTTSSSFTYNITAGDINGNPSPQELDRIVTNVAIPTSPNLKTFLSVVGIPGVVRIDTVFCIANDATSNPLSHGSMSVVGQTMVCPSGFSPE